MSESGRHLEAEACFLFDQVFHFPPERALAARYRLAHEQPGLGDSQADRLLLARLRERRLNVEAVEYVLRLRERRNPLTRKLLILHYLAECDPRTLELFYGGVARQPAWRLLGLPLRCAWLYGLGRYLVWRHGLA